MLHTSSEHDSPGAEDTKSITSSHTSGIVTDIPNSPKLTPVCVCALCTNSESVDAGHVTTNTSGHYYHHHLSHLGLLGSLTRGRQSCNKKKNLSSTSATSSTLCPSPIPSTTSYIPDTVIDEPLELKASKPELRSERGFEAAVQLPPPIKGPFARYGLVSPHKGPASPQGVRVVKGWNGNITISWIPVRYVDMKVDGKLIRN